MESRPRDGMEGAVRRTALNRRPRRPFLEGAEGQSRASTGRKLILEELRRVLRRYACDIGER